MVYIRLFIWIKVTKIKYLNVLDLNDEFLNLTFLFLLRELIY